MAAAGAPPGHYSLGGLQVEVGADQIVRQPGASNYAGSALRPIDGVRRAAAMLNCSWSDAWDWSSVYAARFIGVEHGLTTGCPADLCLVQTDRAGQLKSVRTFVHGESDGEPS